MATEWLAIRWTMPLTEMTNGGAGYIEGVKRLGIPPLVISDAGYGVRDSGANGRYSTAMPSSLGATSSWDPESACAFGEVIGGELEPGTQHDSRWRGRSGSGAPEWPHI